MQPVPAPRRSCPPALALALACLLLVGTPPAGAVTVQWTRTYNGAADSDDSGSGVAVGPDGSIYVAGSTYVSGQSHDVWLRKYSPEGERKWTRTYNGAADSVDTGSDVAVAADGSVYIVGTTYVSGRGYDVWLRKYSPEGAVVWTRRYNGDANSSDFGNSVAVGLDGGVYIAGATYVPNQGYDTWVRRYSPQGRVKWTRTHNGFDDGDDIAYGVAVNPSGDVYATGYTQAAGKSFLWVGKYSQQGEGNRNKLYIGADNAWSCGRGVAISREVSVYVAGADYVYGHLTDIWLLKLTPRGADVWSAMCNGADSLRDEGRGVAVGPDGGIYVTGFREVSGHGYDIWLRKYSPTKAVEWTRTCGGAANLDDVGSDVAVGPDGSVYVTGYTSVSGQGYNVWLRKYR